MSETRSLGVQCQSNKSTAVQTKRLSKEELRYYTKIVDKEKQVLLSFLKATKEYPALRQPHYKINMAPTQTKLRKNFGTRKKRKNKKHASHKTKGKPSDEGDQENTSHYVSKIVVDDATRCLKLRVRSCHPKKSEELKENKSIVTPERARARKAKQPRRYNRSLDSLTEMENINGGINKMENESPEEKPSHQLAKENEESRNEADTPEMNDENNNLSPPNSTILPTKPVKAEVENTDCLFAKSHDQLSSPDSSPLPTMTAQPAPILLPALSDEESPGGQAPSPVGQATSSDDSNYHSPNEDSDDNQSVCSEEFFIVETNEVNVDDGKEVSRMNDESTNKTKPEQTKKINIKETNLKDELKKRLKANLIRKASDSEQHENGEEHSLAKNGSTTSKNEPKVLPQVVSVHFYDPQTHSQRIVGADTHIPFLNNPTVRDPSMILSYRKPPSTTLPYPKSLSATLPYPPHLSQRPQRPASATLTTSRPPNLSQATLPRIPPMSYPYPSYYPNTTEIHQQHPAYQIPSIPPSTKVRALPPDISSATRGVVSCYGSMPAQVSSHHPATATKSIGVASCNASVSRSLPPESLAITAKEDSTSNIKAATSVTTHHPELASNNITDGGVMPTSESSPNDSGNGIEITEIDAKGKKRKRFIFGSHEPPKKKVISSLLTPLCEREATRLADGIHEINMQYFPLRSLAQKAANRVSGDTDDVLKLIEQKIQLKTKIQDVEKARNLLKDIYDMVLKSKEIEDIQNFELVSHNFGVRNILNHLSLVDLYFGELGTELQSKI